mgnify:CR=1 FL=1
MKKNPSKILTQSLLYPAVLGSMFVFVIQNISDRGIMYFGIQLNGYWSLILLANFSISYLNNEYLENYSALNLLLDLVEVILIYFAFKELGLLGSPSFDMESSIRLRFKKPHWIVYNGNISFDIRRILGIKMDLC